MSYQELLNFFKKESENFNLIEFFKKEETKKRKWILNINYS